MTRGDEQRPKGGVRWLFEDRTSGRIVVAQLPNVLLWIYLGACVARALVRSGTPFDQAAHVVESASLSLWALDEMIRGVNPWRRLLGLGVLGAGPAMWLLR